jgi:hypothetical protein
MVHHNPTLLPDNIARLLHGTLTLDWTEET